jgi:arylsulfatase
MEKHIMGKGGKDSPNILFFLPDQHRFDWLEGNSNLPVKTPNLKNLSRRGVLFANAVCPSPLCGPSRACLTSGMEYFRCGVKDNSENFPLNHRTFYHLLQDRGYNVSGCGKFDLHKASFTWGLEGKNSLDRWGFSDGIDNEGKWDAILSYHKPPEGPKGPYMKYLQERGLLELHLQDFGRRKDKRDTFTTPLPDYAYCDNWVAKNGLELMENFPKDKPWFLQVNFTGPHDPWDITESMRHSVSNGPFPQPIDCNVFSEKEHNLIRQNYSAMVENIDMWIGGYTRELEKKGALENTVIIYSSDHGEMLGDHSLWGKAVPYHPSVSVPLIIAGPGIRKNIFCKEPVTTLDLTATILEYAGIHTPEGMDSKSLRPFLEGTDEYNRQYVFSSFRKWTMVYDGRYKFIEGFRDEEILFDLQEDPFETRNLAAEKGSEKKVNGLRKIIKDMQEQNIPEKGL